MYFRFLYSEDYQFIRTNSSYTTYFGNYTNLTFEIWETKFNPIPVTDCFDRTITPRNLVNNGDYGQLFVNNQPVNSGEEITRATGTYLFGTYTGLILGDYKFRNWSYTGTYYSYSNPEDIFLGDNGTVVANFYLTQPVFVLSYLEGGTSTEDNYTVTWQTSEENETLDYGTEYNAFQFNQSNQDKYSFYAIPISTQRYNTTWTFFKWNTGSYNSTISNKKIPDDIPTEGSFIAKYKGHLRSDNNYSFSNNGQRHLVRDENGIYHLYYISLDDNLWYTKSLTTDFNGAWSAEDLVYPGANVKSLSVDIYNNTIYTVLELFTGVKYAIQCLVTDAATGTVTGLFDVTVIDQSYFGSAHPVVAVSENEKFFLYRRTSQGGLYYSRYCTYNGVNYDEFDVLIPNTSSGSLNPAIAVNKTGIPDLHLTYQEGNINGKSIRYRWANGSFYNQRTFTSPLSISEASAYYINTDPSLSLFKKNSSDYEPIVSWLGGDVGAPYKSNGFSIPTPRLIVRACDDYSSGRWGTTNIYGEEVSSTQNNSVTGVLNQSIITWGQKDGTESKWIKRDGINYYGPCSLIPAGINTNVSNGISLDNIKALSFDISALPYIINPCETLFSQPTFCGGQQKIVSTNPFTFSRAGVILKNGIEFAYHTGDIVLDDSSIQFIEVPDTLTYSNTEELNQVLSTQVFSLNSNSSLVFSNCYYVLNSELADSLMGEDETVGYRVELVNSNTGTVAGTFDNITYDKNNLDDYENISYQIDCAGISDGDYFFRLVTSVTGDAEYNLINAVNDAGTVAKRSSNKISFTGQEIPVTYDLSQNFPNPFNPATTIIYQLPQNGFVTLKVYDILGKEVATLVNEQKIQGRYSVNFDASRLASGVYIYQLRVNDYVSSKKMLLLK